MNSNPTNSTPANGRRYWRSLDEVADTPEFKEWLHREFPQGASELDGSNRRHFLKIMAASFAFAGVATLGAGCRRPEEKLEPFGQQPANYIYGKPDYYATSMPTRTGAIPLVAKSYEGRPIKIEGNALYPPAATAERIVMRRLRYLTFMTLTAPSNSRTTASRLRTKKL